MKIELRADVVIIDGYVNAVGRDSRPITSPNGKFVENVEPGTFKKSLERRSDVALYIDHDPTRRVGSTADGVLTLAEDSIGLRAHAEIRDAGAVAEARSGGFRGWSFGFYKNIDRFEERAEDIPRRHLEDIDLYEVSLITEKMLPCYAGTSVELRAEGEQIAETRTYEDDVELSEIKPCDYSEYEKRAYNAQMKPYEDRVEELRRN